MTDPYLNGVQVAMVRGARQQLTSPRGSAKPHGVDWFPPLPENG